MGEELMIEGANVLLLEGRAVGLGSQQGEKRM